MLMLKPMRHIVSPASMKGQRSFVLSEKCANINSNVAVGKEQIRVHSGRVNVLLTSEYIGRHSKELSYWGAEAEPGIARTLEKYTPCWTQQ